MRMLLPSIIAVIVCLTMIASILFFPKLKLGKLRVSTYWLITLAGAVVIFLCSSVKIKTIGAALVADNAINPLKILVLFLSMTVISIFLDELGLFAKLADVALKRNKSGQKGLFFSLYALVSVLTVFTSNDVIILSFTPFICYFAKNAKISPLPYLASEFVAANTWSMLFIIGNPTNIYLATSAGIGFVKYLGYSLLPTLFGGGVSLALLYLLFRKKLKEPLSCESDDVQIEDKFLLWVGIAHLAVATVLLAIGSYIGLQMWIAAFAVMCSLIVFVLVSSLVRRKKPSRLGATFLRAPYEIIPFVLSMFVIVIVLDDAGVIKAMGKFLGSDFQIVKYGLLSFLSANVINNIPMSVLFTSVISEGGAAGLPAVFATIIGSNIGAFLTPVGALAGIMWSSIVNRHGVKMSYADFLRIGIPISVPTILASLGGLWLTVLIL